MGAASFGFWLLLKLGGDPPGKAMSAGQKGSQGKVTGMEDQLGEPECMAAAAQRISDAQQKRGDNARSATLRWTDALHHHPNEVDLLDADPFGGKYEGFAVLSKEAKLAAMELARVRSTLGVTPAAFDPLRHVQMVFGRPVQVVIQSQVMFWDLAVH